MALRKQFIKTLPGFDGELKCKGTYWKVTQLTGNKSQIDFTTGAFVEESQVFGAQYSFTPSVQDGAKNFIAQAYDHLKSLPEFAGAEDC